jgi:hypothetical protein
MQRFIEDDELDRHLREAVPYLDDAGFTARVLHGLPARSAPARLRAAILIAVTLVASALAYVFSGGGRFVNDVLVQLSALPATWLLALTFVAGIIVGAIGLAAAVFKAREPALITR